MLTAEPTASAPRLYVESLNEMIDMHTTRVAALNNRVPTAVIWLQLVATAIAVGVLALHLATVGWGRSASLFAAVIATLILLVIFDLDRPRRGLITVPSAPLAALRVSMDQPPAAVPARR